MGRLIGIDYGTKRTGLALTDPLQIIASPHKTVDTEQIVDYLETLVNQDKVDGFVLGWPTDLQGNETHSSKPVLEFRNRLRNKFPDIPVYEVDEKFTSKMAVRVMIEGGMKKKDRQNKGNIDKISASIILQSYLETKTV